MTYMSDSAVISAKAYDIIKLAAYIAYIIIYCSTI